MDGRNMLKLMISYILWFPSPIVNTKIIIIIIVIIIIILILSLLLLLLF